MDVHIPEEVDKQVQQGAEEAVLHRALNGLRDICATPGRVVCTLPVTKRVQNRYNTLHASRHKVNVLMQAFTRTGTTHCTAGASVRSCGALAEHLWVHMLGTHCLPPYLVLQHSKVSTTRLPVIHYNTAKRLALAFSGVPAQL